MKQRKKAGSQALVDRFQLELIFCEDADFPPQDDLGRPFLNCHTGELRYAKRRLSASRYVEVPRPDHGTWHKHFLKWLGSIGQESSYWGTIGGWLKEVGTQEDRWAWDDYRGEAASRMARAWLNKTVGRGKWEFGRELEVRGRSS